MTINQSHAAAQVILPIIQRVMPSIIAHDVIGVQHMNGSVGDIFNIRGQFNWAGRLVLTKEHFRHFLRVYNRRTRHHPDYLTSLGYQKIRVTRRDDRANNASNALAWCKQNIKPGSYVYSSGDFWFAYDRDATLFTLKWSS